MNGPGVWLVFACLSTGVAPQAFADVLVCVQIDGLPRTAARSKYDLDGGAGAVSLLIRLSHKVRPRRDAGKAVGSKSGCQCCM